MNERLRELRIALKMNQEDFGKLLGITKSGVSDIESGRRKVTDQHIIMLKSQNSQINEHWLRTGEGDMFFKLDKENELMQWAGKVLGNEANSFKKNFIRVLMSLTEDEWELLERKAKELVNYEKENLD